MNKNRKKEIVSVRMLLGLSVAFATSLCFLEYGKPLLGETMKIGTWDPGEFIEIEDIPVTLADLPEPPKPVFEKPIPVLVAAIDPSKISKQQAEPTNELPEFNIEWNEDLYFPTKRAVVAPVELPFRIVQEMPEFPGGDKALLKFLSKRVKFPPMMSDMGMSGIVHLQFVVSSDGSVAPESIQIIRSPHDIFSAEAIAAVKAMPKWKPGKQRGKPVSVYYNLPVHFKLK
jgi:protein TonB